MFSNPNASTVGVANPLHEAAVRSQRSESLLIGLAQSPNSRSWIDEEWIDIDGFGEVPVDIDQGAAAYVDHHRDATRCQAPKGRCKVALKCTACFAVGAVLLTAGLLLIVCRATLRHDDTIVRHDDNLTPAPWTSNPTHEPTQATFAPTMDADMPTFAPTQAPPGGWLSRERIQLNGTLKTTIDIVRNTSHPLGAY